MQTQLEANRKELAVTMEMLAASQVRHEKLKVVHTQLATDSEELQTANAQLKKRVCDLEEENARLRSFS